MFPDEDIFLDLDAEKEFHDVVEFRTAADGQNYQLVG